MKVSLIVTTYNWHEALYLSLQSIFYQRRLPDEIIIADDGSDERTAQMLASLDAPVPLLHAWQEDKGFRASKARNRAIAMASGTYIIGIDGDMILERHFVEDHLRCAQKGVYLQGSRVLLNAQKTKEVLVKKTILFSPFEKGLSNRTNAFRIPFLSRLICKENQKRKGIRSCNFSLYKEDILRVNGFNEAFVSWGREDSEFVERLYNVGVKRKNIKFSAIEYHLYHDEGKAAEKNDTIWQKTIDEKLQWCEDGIDKYIKEGR